MTVPVPTKNPDLHGNVPEALLADCVVSNTPADNQYALQHIQRVLNGDITPSEDLNLDALVRPGATPGVMK